MGHHLDTVAFQGPLVYLSLTDDIVNRSIPGYEVYVEENRGRHADNGAAMTSQTLKAKRASLNITGSHRRPRVSNDNPSVASLFRTLNSCRNGRQRGAAT